MAKRKGKKRSYRRRKNFNLLNLAQGFIVGNALTKGFFGTDLKTFALDGWFGSVKTAGKGWDNSWEVTLGEIITQPNQGRDASNWSMAKVVQHNLQENGAMMIGTAFLAPIAFKFGKKAMRPLLTPVRGALKGTGVTV